MTDASTLDPIAELTSMPGILLGEGGAVLADIEAEKRLVGALILNPDVVEVAASEMTAEDLVDCAHRRLFTCFVDASNSGYAVGIKSLTEALGGDPYHPAFEDMTAAEYIAHLTANGDSRTQVDQLAVYLHECAERRANETADDDSPEPPPPFESKMGATFFHEIGRQKPQRIWHLKNLLLASVFGIVYGPPGCGKSFLVTDMALTGAAAPFLSEDQRPDWFGYRGKQFGTVYVVAEGHEDFEIRLHAWRQANGIPQDAFIPFAFLPTSIDMRSSDADTKKLHAEIVGLDRIMKARCGVGVDLVVIDTVARVLAGGNENASEVMSAFVRNCGKLQASTKVAAIGVHHGGKEGGRGPRGHEALHGAADLEIEVTGATEESPNTFVIRKLKAGPGGATHRFRLKQVVVGVDEDQENITSCVVSDIPRVREASGAGDDADKPIGFKLSNNEALFFRCVIEALSSLDAVPPEPRLGLPSSVGKVVDYEHVKLLMHKRMLPDGEIDDAAKKAHKEKVKKALQRARESLTRYQVIGTDAPWIWHTGKPVRGFPSTMPRRETTWRRPEQDPIGPPGDDITDIIRG